MDFVVNNRRYEILEKDEGGLSRITLLRRASNLWAFLGEDDGEYILNHQANIPVCIQEVVLFFAGWEVSYEPDSIYYLAWWEHGEKWIKNKWGLDEDLWLEHFRLIRHRL